MHHASRTPLDLGRLADDPRLGASVRAAAARARRRAVRDGDRRIDTAHLLHSLLESDPEVRERCDTGSGGLARVLGYLAQRAIGYGLRWSGSVEDSGALPLLPARARPDAGWSPAAAAAMRAAVTAAGRQGRARASGTDLLDALLADPASRARQVLRAAGAEAGVVAGHGPAGPVLPSPRDEPGVLGPADRRGAVPPGGPSATCGCSARGEVA